eukprot:1304010-Pyramimonas_sp.AAC.1
MPAATPRASLDAQQLVGRVARSPSAPQPGWLPEAVPRSSRPPGAQAPCQQPPAGEPPLRRLGGQAPG